MTSYLQTYGTSIYSGNWILNGGASCFSPSLSPNRHGSRVSGAFAIKVLSGKDLGTFSMRPLKVLIDLPLARSTRPLLSPPRLCPSINVNGSRPRRWGSTAFRFGRDDSTTRSRSSSWTTGRVLLVTAFTSALTYVYGVTDAGSRLAEFWQLEKAGTPRYCNENDLIKVRVFVCATLPPCRLPRGRGINHRSLGHRRTPHPAHRRCCQHGR